MRWNIKNPATGERRTIERFLFFRREIGGEIRWLEKSRIVQRYQGYCHRVTGKSVGGEWIDVEFEEDTCQS